MQYPDAPGMPRLFYSPHFQAGLCKGAADKCLIICIGPVNTGVFDNITITPDRDMLMVTFAVSTIASRWLAADKNNYCIIAASQAVDRAGLKPEWISACALVNSNEASTFSDALFTTARPNWFARVLKLKDISPRARSFFKSFDSIRRNPEQFTIPELFLTSLEIRNLPKADPEKGTRIFLLVSNNGQIQFSSMHTGRLQWQTDGDLSIRINCKVKGLATIKGYHVPERMSSEDPRRLLFEIDIHSGVANCCELSMDFPRTCIDRVPPNFPSDFCLSARFSAISEPFEQAPCRILEELDSDFMFALNLQRQLDREEADVAPDSRVSVNVTDSGVNMSDDARLRDSGNDQVVSSFDFNEELDDPFSYPLFPDQMQVVDSSRPSHVTSPGASRLQLSRLPEFNVAVGSSLISKVCPICKECINEGELMRTLPCLHIMHSPCITEWLCRKAACPVCLTPLS